MGGPVLRTIYPPPRPFIHPGRKWQLWQMHVHTPSEHTVNGAYYPVEVHLVHIPYGEELNLITVTQALVLGVFLSAGKTSNKIMEIITHYPADEYEHLWRAVNIYSLVPKNKAYCTCLEGQADGQHAIVSTRSTIRMCVHTMCAPPSIRPHRALHRLPHDAPLPAPHQRVQRPGA